VGSKTFNSKKLIELSGIHQSSWHMYLSVPLKSVYSLSPIGTLVSVSMLTIVFVMVCQMRCTVI